MQSDLPHTLYKPMKKRGGKKVKEKGTDNYRVNPNDPAFAKQQAVYEKALARKKAQMEGKEPYTMQELFR